MREKCRLRVFENKVLRRIFGPKRDEVTGEWRRLHNKELCALYTSPDSGDQVKKTEVDKACSTYGGRRGAYRILVGKLEGRRPIGRHRRRWKDNIKVDLRKVGWGADWIDLAQDRNGWRSLVNAVIYFRVP